MSIYFRVLIGLYLFILPLSYLMAAEPLVLKKGEVRYTLEKQLSYFIDTKAQLTIQSVIDGDYHEQFIDAKSSSVNFGFNLNPVWLAFSIKNPSNDAKTLYVEINYPLINEVIFFYEDYNGAIKQFNTGLNYSYDNRPIKNKNFVFPIELKPFESQTYYLKIQSEIPFAIPITVNTPLAYVRYIDKSHLILGAYFGLIAVMMFYNLFLFVSVKDIAYFYYVFFIISSAFVELALSGLGYQFWPNAIKWNQIHLFFSVAITEVFILQFGRTFLHIKQKMPKLDKFIIGMMITWITLIIILVVYPIISYIPIILSAMVSLITQMTAGIVILKSGYQPARFFLIATTAFAIGGFVTGLMGLGLVDWSETTRYIFAIGGGLEAVLLSLALADRINLLKKEKYESMEKAAMATAQAQAKSDFLAKMSHEIRTPMNGVLGMIELLNDTELKPDQKHYVNVIRNSGRTLLSVINDILDHAKIEAGKMELEKISFQLDNVIDECISVFAVSANDKTLELISDIHHETPLFLIGDPIRLRQILLNLIGNAFKFTEQGQIKLTAFPLNTNENIVTIRFEVTDTGIGIDEEKLAKLFSSFEQADKSITRRFGGTGLGLTISKQLVELMDGEIGVISEKNHGSTFWFTAKFEMANEIAVQEATSSEIQLANKHALLLIFNSDMREYLSDLLSSWNIHLLTADSNEQAIELLRQPTQSPVDVLFIDDANGQEATNHLIETIRAEMNDAELPIILFSMQTENAQPESATSNAYEVIHWPVNDILLYQLLVKVLNIKQKPIETESHADAVVDFQGMRVLVAEDNLVNQLVIKGLLNKMGITPLVVENGAKAVTSFMREKTPFDIIFMDCEMPELDGYSATKRIRQFEDIHLLPHTPIIALTAHAMQEHRQKSIDAGMDDHLSKPISWDNLTDVMYKWTNRII